MPPGRTLSQCPVSGELQQAIKTRPPWTQVLHEWRFVTSYQVNPIQQRQGEDGVNGGRRQLCNNLGLPASS